MRHFQSTSKTLSYQCGLVCCRDLVIVGSDLVAYHMPLSLSPSSLASLAWSALNANDGERRTCRPGCGHQTSSQHGVESRKRVVHLVIIGKSENKLLASIGRISFDNDTISSDLARFKNSVLEKSSISWLFVGLALTCTKGSIQMQICKVSIVVDTTVRFSYATGVTPL